MPRDKFAAVSIHRQSFTPTNENLFLVREMRKTPTNRASFATRTIRIIEVDQRERELQRRVRGYSLFAISVVNTSPKHNRDMMQRSCKIISDILDGTAETENSLS